MKQKLILVSMDAMIAEDLEYLKTKPSFGWLYANSARVERVKSVYPTLTYPCHGTMITGCWPAKHGLLHNTKLQPGSTAPDWQWYHDVFQTPDLLDAAKAKGLTTAAIGWPAMGNHPHADWIVGEIAATKAKTEAEFRADYLRTGTTEALWNEVGAPNIFWRTERGNNVTCFNAAACCGILRGHQPDLTILHLAEPDSVRHKFGVYAPQVREKLDQAEQVLTWILDAIRDADMEDCTNLIVTADHGQMDVTQTANPNVLLTKNGFVTLNEDGSVKDWRAWCRSTGMSATVHVKDPADEAAVLACLQGQAGIEQVFTRAETSERGYGGDFSFMLEGDGKTKIDNTWLGDYLTVHPARGNHGYLPEKGPRHPLLAAGPGFRTGVILEHADLMDGAPTWAKALGLDLPDADGRVLEELLK